MKRTAIKMVSKTGEWFDIEKAECFNEKNFWNGHNHISKSTGQQWRHEAIFITKGGKFILNESSDVQGEIETFKIIEKDEAAEWFCKNEYSDEEIPDIFHENVKRYEIL